MIFRNKFMGFKFDFVFVSILIVSIFLRIYQLDFQSVWLDEIHTMIETDPSLTFSEYLDLMFKREQMPHFYFITVKLFTFIFGSSVFVVRLVSAIIGIFSVYVIFLLGKELDSVKTGYFASLFLCVNQFHIFYSQEARPYILLSLLTITSFLFLVKFIKKRDRRAAIYYAISAAFLINTHFFGLFVLVAQAIVILIALMQINREKLKVFFVNSTISGVLIILLFAPSFKMFLKVSSLKSFWIESPKPEFFSGLINRFFGSSEFLVYVSVLITLAFFVKIFSLKPKKDIYNNKYVLSFVVLIVWLATVFMIPFIRSYTSVPMLLNRYFMSALPAIILILAIGLNTIKSKAVVAIFVVFFMLSSFTDIFLVKDYYQRINKTQFREITSEVKSKNSLNSPIVSPWTWHLNYFMPKAELIPANLNEYVDILRQSNNVDKSFWILDAHFHDFVISKANKEFLERNFHLVDNINYFDAWAKYYLKKDKETLTNISLSSFSPNFLNEKGHIELSYNTTVRSIPFNFKEGTYRLAIQTISTPNPPINNENSHIGISIGTKDIGAFFADSKSIETVILDFDIKKDTNNSIELTFGNDLVRNNEDRDLLIYGLSIEKIK